MSAVGFENCSKGETQNLKARLRNVLNAQNNILEDPNGIEIWLRPKSEYLTDENQTQELYDMLSDLTLHLVEKTRITSIEDVNNGTFKIIIRIRYLGYNDHSFLVANIDEKKVVRFLIGGPEDIYPELPLSGEVETIARTFEENLNKMNVPQVFQFSDDRELFEL